MDKKQQLINFLQDQLFNPVLHSPYASSQLKADFRSTLRLLEQFSAEGILCYIWNTLASAELEPVLAHRLEDEGFNNYHAILNTFKQRFTYDWLIS